jgi:hypothetical protein
MEPRDPWGQFRAHVAYDDSSEDPQWRMKYIIEVKDCDGVPITLLFFAKKCGTGLESSAYGVFRMPWVKTGFANPPKIPIPHLHPW